MADKSEKEIALEAKIKELEAAQAKTAKEADAMLQELQSKLEDAEASKGSAKPVISHKKDKYQVVVPRFRIGDAEYTVKDIQENRIISVQYRDEKGKKQSKDVKIVDHLVATGSGVLVAL